MIPNRAPQKGGLIYAPYGRGVYVYVAFALYRQLPDGVPGAYRLFANLLELAAQSCAETACRSLAGQRLEPEINGRAWRAMPACNTAFRHATILNCLWLPAIRMCRQMCWYECACRKSLRSSTAERAPQELPAAWKVTGPRAFAANWPEYLAACRLSLYTRSIPATRPPSASINCTVVSNRCSSTWSLTRWLLSSVTSAVITSR